MIRRAWVWLSALLLAACTPTPPPEGETFQLQALLGGAPQTGFARAEAPREFRFPEDHGPHPGFRSEWWYFTGNLRSENGERFGYQWTLFRFALTPQPPERRSHWATHQLYMGHFALTDIRRQDFRFFERLQRDALDLAGAETTPLRMWIDHWQLDRQTDGAWRLQTQGDEGHAIDLILTPIKPVVLQGEQGLSQKSTAAGNASYYYSIPRLQTRGELRFAGERYQVEGLSWLDREWSTSALGPDQAGWDWFALQLDDGYDLMYYRLRRNDGSVDPLSSGSLIDAEGRSIRLNARDVEATVLSHWRSEDGTLYPARWRLSVPEAALELEVTPAVAQQELQASVRYWEGAVDVVGTRAGRAVRGRGYMELAGYD